MGISAAQEPYLKANSRNQRLGRDLTRDLGPQMVVIVMEMGPLISGKSRLVKYCNLVTSGGW